SLICPGVQTFVATGIADLPAGTLASAGESMTLITPITLRTNRERTDPLTGRCPILNQDCAVEDFRN
ncbi:MAG: hypothetical protein ACK58L_17845, partial [Planctomycetota bacterium]